MPRVLHNRTRNGAGTTDERGQPSLFRPRGGTSETSTSRSGRKQGFLAQLGCGTLIGWLVWISVQNVNVPSPVTLSSMNKECSRVVQCQILCPGVASPMTGLLHQDSSNRDKPGILFRRPPDRVLGKRRSI